ncbi:MAG: aminoacyl-tRNA hydrolase [Candidatus Hydrogenedentes bacterium]|nr:aminoacyl-tRNA hydrolase [Candidatus Hydrogenedentota bacterium]
MIHVTDDIALYEREVKCHFVRSSGPGGQNVNKVATAVQLRFDVSASDSIGEDVKRRLKRLAGKRMGEDGVLRISAQRFRTQERNREDAIERLVALIRAAAKPPKPRRKTRTPRASKEQRLSDKQRRSGTKRTRARVDPTSD